MKTETKTKTECPRNTIDGSHQYVIAVERHVGRSPKYYVKCKLCGHTLLTTDRTYSYETVHQVSELGLIQ